MMKRKKAFLLAEETVKIVIALIVIGFLIFLLTSLYYSRLEAQKLKQANEILLNSTVGSLRQKISELPIGQSINFALNNPTGWYFFTYANTAPPTKCGGQTCVCICDETWFESSQAGECHKNGACLITKLQSREEEGELKMYISSSSYIKVSKNEAGFIKVEEVK